MPESWSTRRMRWAFRLHPAYRGTGGRVTYIAADWREVRVEVPLARRTRNYVGTIFGGSIYGAVDPIYMIMVITVLGPEFIVWDKAATIRFQKPGRSTLFARFILDDAELDAIRHALAHQRSVERTYTVEVADAQGTICATIEKVLYVRRNKAAARSPAAVEAPVTAPQPNG